MALACTWATEGREYVSGLHLRMESNQWTPWGKGGGVRKTYIYKKRMPIEFSS